MQGIDVAYSKQNVHCSHEIVSCVLSVRIVKPEDIWIALIFNKKLTMKLWFKEYYFIWQTLTRLSLLGVVGIISRYVHTFIMEVQPSRKKLTKITVFLFLQFFDGF